MYGSRGDPKMVAVAPSIVPLFSRMTERDLELVDETSRELTFDLFDNPAYDTPAASTADDAEGLAA